MSGIEQHDGRQMRRQPARVVLVEDGDELGAQPGRLLDVGRHQAEVRPRRSDGQHGAHRLQHLARREARDRRFHGRDQLGHRQQRLDVVFGQEAEALHKKVPRVPWCRMVPWVLMTRCSGALRCLTCCRRSS